MPATSFLILALTGALLVSGCAASPAGGGAVTPGATPAASAPGPSRPGSRIFYAPVMGGRYRLDSRDSLSMEMPDGSFQRTVTVKTSYLTMTFEPAARGLRATIVLDSMALDRPNTLLQPMVDSTRGTEWRGILSSSGRFDSLLANHPSLFGEQVRTMLGRLMPVLPAEGVEAGRSWSDTATVPFNLMAGFEASEQRQADYHAAKTEDTRGVRTIPIQSSIVYSVSGHGSAMGPEIHLEGTGRATGTHRLSVGGRLIEAAVSDSINMTLQVPAAGQTVPAVVIATYSLRSMP